MENSTEVEDGELSAGVVPSLDAILSIPVTVQVVLGETSMPYRSAIQFLPLGTWNLHAATYMLPRASSTITLTS